MISHSRWLTYATASAASAFANAKSADAYIHYSGLIHQRFAQCYGDTATFPLDQRSNFIRLIHSLEFCGTDYGGGAYFGVFARSGAWFAGVYNTCNHHTSVSRLNRGDVISARPFLPGNFGVLAIASRSLCGGTGIDWIGQFDGHHTGYIGFKFDNGQGDQCGWVRIRMQKGINQNFELIDYAWGDVGDLIKAGQKSSNEMVPDQGSLGWLALGALGLLAWRKSRSSTVTKITNGKV